MSRKIPGRRYFFFAVLFFLSGPAAQAQQSHAVVPYHGMRMTAKYSDFYIVRIKAGKDAFGELVIDVYFNSAVDPRTVTQSLILADGTPLPQGTTEVFNKAGTEVRLTFSENDGEKLVNKDKPDMSLTFTAAASFNGSPLIQNEFDGITDGYAQVFHKPSGAGGK
jgi:hypothetical protein